MVINNIFLIYIYINTITYGIIAWVSTSKYKHKTVLTKQKYDVPIIFHEEKEAMPGPF